MIACSQVYKHRCTNPATLFGSNIGGEWQPFCYNCQVIVNEIMGLEDDYQWVKIDFSNQPQRDIDDPEWIQRMRLAPLIREADERAQNWQPTNPEHVQEFDRILLSVLYKAYIQGRADAPLR